MPNVNVVFADEVKWKDFVKAVYTIQALVVRPDKELSTHPRAVADWFVVNRKEAQTAMICQLLGHPIAYLNAISRLQDDPKQSLDALCKEELQDKGVTQDAYKEERKKVAAAAEHFSSLGGWLSVKKSGWKQNILDLCAGFGILATESDFIAAPTRSQTAAGTIGIGKEQIASLTPRVGLFLGRDLELEKLRKLIREKESWGILITGSPGLGKTSLALKAADELVPEYFERQVVVSAKKWEFDDDGIRSLESCNLDSWDSMSARIAQEVGAYKLAIKDGRISEIILSAIADRRLLFIFDNLEDLPRKDVEKLLTFVERLPKECQAILTSRRSVGNAQNQLPLKPLDKSASLALIRALRSKSLTSFGKLSTKEEEALATAASGNPLLARWMSSNLSNGRNRTVRDVIQFLRTRPSTNDPLSFIYRSLVEMCSPAEVSVLSALCLVSGTLPTRSIGSLANLSARDAESSLFFLWNHSMIEADKDLKRFSVVPAAAEFLHINHRQSIKKAIERGVQRAKEIVAKNGFPYEDRFNLLEAEWASIEPFLPHVLAGPNDELQAFANSVTEFLNFTGRWGLWLSFNQKALERAIESHDHVQAVRRAVHIAGAHYTMGHPPKPIAQMLTKAESLLAEVSGQPNLQFRVARLRGLALMRVGKYAAARNAYQDCLRILRSDEARQEKSHFDIENDISRIENSIGIAYQHEKKYVLAEKHYKESLRIAIELGVGEGATSCRGNLAELAFLQGNWVLAEERARESLKYSQNKRNSRKELHGHDAFFLAASLAKQGKRGKEFERLKAITISIYKELKHPDLKEAEDL